MVPWTGGQNQYLRNRGFRDVAARFSGNSSKPFGCVFIVIAKRQTAN
jgi:hypothetical protein